MNLTPLGRFSSNWSNAFSYAAIDLDLQGLRFTVSGEGKSDVAFLPKNHEERQVPLTTELGSLLADHKKHAVSDRWVFTNEDGKPEGHFLRKFKTIARRSARS